MKKFAVVFLVSLFFASIAYAENVITPVASDATTAAEQISGAKKYFCPMDGFTSNKPGKCEKCGMDLIEMPEIPAADASAAVATPTE